MIIGVPKETRKDEYRVGMLPVGVHELIRAGHTVLVETDAGMGSGLADSLFAAEGAEIVRTTRELYDRAELIVKVKSLQRSEFSLVRNGQILFNYFHFSADRELTEAMLKTGATCLAYETLTTSDGELPLLTPMSEVAGRMCLQLGARFLEKPKGRGILLSSVPGVPPAHVTIIGGGVVGSNAARIAAGFRTDVVVLDIDMQRLRYLDDVMPPNVNVLHSNRDTIREELRLADLLICAPLIPGSRTPCLVRQSDLQTMKPGSVIIDVSVDQGGCVETTRPTSHSDPVFTVDEIIHYCVPNMPGAVGRTSSFALCNVTLPYVMQIANRGILDSACSDPSIREAVNIHAGNICYRPVAETFQLACHGLT